MLLEKLYTIVESFLFEKDTLVEELEKMDSETFKRRAMPSMQGLFCYKDPLVKALVWNMKFRRNRKCFALAGALLYEELARKSAKMSQMPPGPIKLLIIPVPLSRKRRCERGYNQTELLAKEICKHDTDRRFEIAAHCIIRQHSTTQTSLSRKERKENLRGIFKVKDIAKVSGRNIIILDDVITTGATVEEIERVLRKAGAKDVRTLAFAH